MSNYIGDRYEDVLCNVRGVSGLWRCHWRDEWLMSLEGEGRRACGKMRSEIDCAGPLCIAKDYIPYYKINSNDDILRSIMQQVELKHFNLMRRCQYLTASTCCKGVRLDESMMV